MLRHVAVISGYLVCSTLHRDGAYCHAACEGVLWQQRDDGQLHGRVGLADDVAHLPCVHCRQNSQCMGVCVPSCACLSWFIGQKVGQCLVRGTVPAFIYDLSALWVHQVAAA